MMAKKDKAVKAVKKKAYRACKTCGPLTRGMVEKVGCSMVYFENCKLCGKELGSCIY